MATTYPIHIDERVPARVVRLAGPASEGRALCDVTARRFMDVLVHPVPALEMQERLGTFQLGGKIFVDWPEDPTDWESVVPGDQLEIEGHAFTIRGIRDSPVCYSEIYVDAH